MEKTKVNISQAARLTGKDRKTIQRHMEKGTLSFERDRGGKRLVDIAELQRVYGNIKVPAAPEVGHNEESPQRTAPEVVQVLRERVGDLEKQVEMLGTDKEELRQDKEKLWKQVEHYQRLLPPPEEGEVSEDKQEKITIKASQDEEKPKQPKGKAKPASKKKGLFRRMFGGGKK